MKNVIRKLALFVVIIMVAVLAVSCNKKDNINQTSTISDNNKPNIASPEISSEVEEKKDDKKDDSLKPIFNATVEETVLFDEKNIVITAEELTTDSYYVILKINIENNTSKEYEFISGSIGYCVNTVNGYMVEDGYINETIDAGMTSSVRLKLEKDRLLSMGINEIAEIGVGFEVKGDNYKTYLQTGELTVKTSEYDGYDFSKDIFADVMNSGNYWDGYELEAMADQETDSDEVVISAAYLVKDEYDQYTMLIDMENCTGEDVYAIVKSICVNGIKVNSTNWSSDYITSGRRCVISVNLASAMRDKEKFVAPDGIGYLSIGISAENLKDKELLYHIIDMKIGTAEAKTSDEDILYDKKDVVMTYLGLEVDDYFDDINLFILVENNTSKGIYVDDDYGSGAYINKSKIDSLTWLLYLDPGEKGIIVTEFDDDDLEEIDLSIDDIEEITVKYEIRDAKSYKDIDKPKITIEL